MWPGNRAREELLVRGLRRRLWVERAFWVLVIAGLVAWHLRGHGGRGRACLIAIDGQPAAVVANPGEAKRLLEEIKAASGLPPEKVGFLQKVTLHQVSAAQNPVLPDREAIASLSTRLQPSARGAAILADGALVIAVPDQKEAVRTLALILKQFTPPGGRASVFFKEEVSIDVRDVPLGKLTGSAEEAVRRVVEGQLARTVHRVRPGESGWKIARDYDVELPRLAHANPDLDLDRLRVGDRVQIPGPLPALTVVARREVEEEAGGGAAGRGRRVRIIYENGVEMRREIIGRTRRPPARDRRTRPAGDRPGGTEGQSP